MRNTLQGKAGYLLPDDPDVTERICVQLEIPNDERYIQAFKGHLAQLGKWWTWEKTYDVGDRGATIAAQLWRKAIYETLSLGECGEDDMACCDDLLDEIRLLRRDIKRTSEVNTINNYDQTDVLNEYNTFISNYNSSTDVVTDFAPNNKTPSETGDTALCQAIDTFIDTLSDAAIRAYDGEIVAIGAIGAALTIAVAIGSAFATGGLTAPLAIAAIGSAVSGGLGIISNAEKLLWGDPELLQEIKCCMFENMKGQEPTLALFTTSLEGCPDMSAGALNVGSVMSTSIQASPETLHAGFLYELNKAYDLAEVGLAYCGCEELDTVEIQLNFATGQSYTLTRISDNQFSLQYFAPNSSLFLTEVGDSPGANSNMPDVNISQFGSFPPYVEFTLPYTPNATLPLNTTGLSYVATSYFGAFNQAGIYMTSATGTTLNIIENPL